MRVILAGILGGVLIFMAGAFSHTVLQLGARTMQNLPDDTAFAEFITSQNLTHGVYGFPGSGAHATQEEWDKLNELYKRGPNGILFIGRTGEDMMSARELIFEFLSNVVVAFLAAFVVSRLNANANFGLRWAIVVLFGIAAWFSINTSHAIWYRFHWDFVRDEFFCTLLESAVAGLVIAALVKPSEDVPAATPS